MFRDADLPGHMAEEKQEKTFQATKGEPTVALKTHKVMLAKSPKTNDKNQKVIKKQNKKTPKKQNDNTLQTHRACGSALNLL